MSMYWYRAAGVVADQTGQPIKVERERLIEEFGPRAPSEEQGPYLDRMFSRGLDIVLDDPVPAAKNSVRGLVRSVFGINFVFTSSDLPRSPLLVAALALSLGALWLLAAVGTLASWAQARSRPAGVILFVLVAYVLVVSAGPESYSRFRAPVEPLLCVLAAWGATRIARALPLHR